MVLQLLSRSAFETLTQNKGLLGLNVSEFAGRVSLNDAL